MVVDEGQELQLSSRTFGNSTRPGIDVNNEPPGQNSDPQLNAALPSVDEEAELHQRFEQKYDNFTPMQVKKSGVQGIVSEPRDDLLATLRDIGKRHLNKNETLLGQWLGLHKMQQEFETTDFFKLSQTLLGGDLTEEFSPENVFRTVQVWHNRFSLFVCFLYNNNNNNKTLTILQQFYLSTGGYHPGRKDSTTSKMAEPSKDRVQKDQG
jgi:hypothetical protein